MAKVKFYASLRNRTGIPEEEVEVKNIKALLDELSSRYGSEVARHLRICTILVNGRNVVHLKGKRTPLGQNDVVSIFPPLGGG